MGNNPVTFKYTTSNQFVPGSVVVITGASSGMGREMAFRYAERGCKVVMGARRLEELEKVKAKIFDKCGNSNVIPV